jgi:K+-sensing histidine kinase KdpD
MSNSNYKSFIHALSKGFYGIDVSIKHGIIALLMIFALFLLSVLTAASLVSLFFMVTEQKPYSFLYYLSAFAMASIAFGLFWNMATLFGKRITSLKLFFQPQYIGTIILTYILLILASFSIAFKIKYSDNLKSIDNLVNILNNKTTNDIYLFFSILISQVFLVAIILIERRLVIDSTTTKMIEKKATRYEKKAKEYDMVFDHYFVELKSSQKKYNSNRNHIDLLTDSNHKTYILDWNNKTAENEFLENSKSQLYKTLESIRSIDREKDRELQVKIFSGISHELGNKIPFVHGDLEQLINFIRYRHLNIFSERIKESDNSEKIEDLLSRMNNSLDYSKKMLASMGKILKCDPSKMQKVKININQLLTKVFESQKFQKGKVSLVIDNVYCQELLLEEVQFRLFLESMFENANRHAFKYEKKYTIHFKFTTDNKYIYMDIYNNGEPVSDQFTIDDFITPSKYLGETGNTGIGGYLINLVINNHGGKIISIGNTKDSLGNPIVLFKFLIPFKLDTYES